MTPTAILNNEKVKEAIEIVGPVEWEDEHAAFIEWLGKRVQKAHHLTIEWIPYSKLWSINMGATQIYDNPHLTVAAAMAVNERR